MDAAFAPDDAPAPVRAARALSRALSDAGADETNRTDDTPDEPIGRCRGYAHDVLAEAIDATTMADRKALVKQVGAVAKYAGSIAAVLGHAGRVRAPAGEDAVDWACGAMWAAIRADVAALVALGAIPPRLSAARDRVAALRKLAPFWPGRRPAWATPGAHVRKRPDGGRRLG
ncbi:MAG: hypothetical protein U1F43_22695 [Myxococcota bacterium]